ncbi:hypothetical protein C1884_27645 [Pseudomonas sp. GW460-R15]|nr:hypothetical protein C1887_24980 [Pseudomonas sp. GW456-R21]POA62115.1 hypothetical protein C1884_27645 [Pseudomonas sp. GW460-R15]
MKYLKDAGNVLATFVKPLRDGGENRSLGAANLQGFVFSTRQPRRQSTYSFTGADVTDSDSVVYRVIVGETDCEPAVMDGLGPLGEPWFVSEQGDHEQMLFTL